MKIYYYAWCRGTKYPPCGCLYLWHLYIWFIRGSTLHPDMGPQTCIIQLDPYSPRTWYVSLQDHRTACSGLPSFLTEQGHCPGKHVVHSPLVCEPVRHWAACLCMPTFSGAKTLPLCISPCGLAPAEGGGVLGIYIGGGVPWHTKKGGS